MNRDDIKFITEGVLRLGPIVNFVGSGPIGVNNSLMSGSDAGIVVEVE
jgi:hypothetical protein